MSRTVLVVDDEPLARSRLRRLVDERGTTILFTTHDQRLLDHARRVVTMVDGAVFSDEAVSSA